jgi:hypothetical protein
MESINSSGLVILSLVPASDREKWQVIRSGSKWVRDDFGENQHYRVMIRLESGVEFAVLVACVDEGQIKDKIIQQEFDIL